jgi:hypothetical protein
MAEDKHKAYSSALVTGILLFLSTMLLFGKVVFSGDTLYGSDFVFQFYPWKKFIYEQVWANGSLPFWNPYLLSGSPFITNIQASMFYPLGFLYYLVPPDIAYVYSTLLHVVLGLGFMYLFMRSLAVHPAGCFFSALVFMFNGFFMGHLYAGHLSFVQNYIWIPLILFFLKRVVERGSLCDATRAGVSLGFQVLGGFPQIAFYTILASFLFVLIGWAHSCKGKGNVSAAKVSAGWVLFVFLGFALAAVQVFPTYEFTTLSTRGGGISYEMATYESLHPKEILAFLLPDLFGNAVDGTYWRSREFWHFWESCGYVGILPLFLLFIKAPSEQPSWVRGFAVALIAISFFLALGKYNPLYPLIYRLPGFGSFRLPVQILFLYVVGVGILSGLGLSSMIRAEWKLTRGFWIFSSVAGAGLVAGLAGLTFYRLEFFLALFRHFSEGAVTHANLTGLGERISGTLYRGSLFLFISLFLILLVKYRKVGPGLFSMLACLIVFADLHGFVSPFVRTHEFVLAPEKKLLLSQLSKTPETGRVVTGDSRFNTNDGLMYRFPSIQGYDPLILKKYVDYVLSSQGLPPNDHVVNLHEIPAPQAKLIKLLHARQKVSGGEIKELENHIPYAFLVPNAIVKPEEEILSFMKGEDFNPLKTVVFSKQPKHGEILAEDHRPFEGTCHVLSRDTEEIRFRVSCNQPAYLVMSEIWYPGWVASVDGRGREVSCGNYLFRVVPVEQGNHEITLTFVSWPFRIGALVSTATAMFGVLFWWGCRRRSSLKGLREKTSAA